MRRGHDQRPRLRDGKVPLGLRPHPLSAFARELWTHARRVSVPEGPLGRLGTAVDVAVKTYGREAAITAAGLTDLAEFAVAARGRLVVHSVRPGAARLVRETELPIVPDRCPVALEGPLLVEARHADRGECLVGDVTGIAVHPQPDNLHGACLRVVVRSVPDGLYVFRWVPRWTGEDVARTVDVVGLAGFPLAQPTGVTAARFLLVFALLLEASRSPLRAETDAEEVPARGNGKGAGTMSSAPAGPAPTGLATTTHVYLSRDFERERAAAQQAQARVHARRADLAETPVMVSGHLQRYPVGPREEGRREWRFVSPYASTRLAGSRSTVDVHRVKGDRS